ncbi:hypothetical protein KBD20_01760 [Candidatus Saccharibacteria bacterium]|nr:hypothetical protein [Candidatus Saccharibacteria bacterium]
MNSTAELVKKIQSEHERLVYISGRTCTGKSTLSRAIRDALDFSPIDLDQVVFSLSEVPGKNRFEEVYLKREDMAMINDFVMRTQNEINENLKSHPGVIFEGAIATNETLKQVIGDRKGFLFVYLLPVNLDVYRERICKRFALERHGLPDRLWEIVSKEQHRKYLDDHKMTQDLDAGLSRFAQVSMQGAKTRLDMFRESFKDIFVIEV